MNSGFNPKVVAPSAFRVQTATQQRPFYFAGSYVPTYLGDAPHHFVRDAAGNDVTEYVRKHRGRMKGKGMTGGAAIRKADGTIYYTPQPKSNGQAL